MPDITDEVHDDGLDDELEDDQFDDDEHDDELDVELDVIEEPPVPQFPRRPNVVSRRAHKIRVNVTILEGVPAGTTHVRIDADVLDHGNSRLGHSGHTFTAETLWGSNTEVVPLPHTPTPGNPVRLSIVVERRRDDDHLGQGPYGGFVTVTPTSGNLGSARDHEGIPLLDGQTFYIGFVSM